MCDTLRMQYTGLEVLWTQRTMRDFTSSPDATCMRSRYAQREDREVPRRKRVSLAAKLRLFAGANDRSPPLVYQHCCTANVQPNATERQGPLESPFLRT